VSYHKKLVEIMSFSVLNQFHFFQILGISPFLPTLTVILQVMVAALVLGLMPQEFDCLHPWHLMGKIYKYWYI